MTLRYIFEVGAIVVVSPSYGENWTYHGQIGEVMQKLDGADKYKVKLDVNGKTIEEYGSGLRRI